MIDVGENILATVGIDHALARRTSQVRPRGLTRPMEAEIRAHIRRFMGDSAPTDPPKLPAFSYDKALDELSDSRPPDHSAVADIASEDAGAYFACVARAVKFLQAIMPRALERTTTGTYNLTPSDVEVSDFRRAWAVGCDPILALRALTAGMLTQGTVVALQAMFPSIYAEIRIAIDDETTDRRGRDLQWRLPGRKDDQLSTLTQTQVTTPQLAKRLQQVYEDQKNQKGVNTPGDQRPPKPKASPETQMQRIART